MFLISFLGPFSTMSFTRYFVVVSKLVNSLVVREYTLYDFSPLKICDLLYGLADGLSWQTYHVHQKELFSSVVGYNVL